MVDLEAYDLIFMDQHMASTEKQMLGTETVRAEGQRLQEYDLWLSANV
jgi:hypothetical protein